MNLPVAMVPALSIPSALVGVIGLMALVALARLLLLAVGLLVLPGRAGGPVGRPLPPDMPDEALLDLMALG
ncbi:MAG: hypothetical protein ACK5UG_01230 [Synechococcaceae cyanobacterium]|jgi:hypothetical protein